MSKFDPARIVFSDGRVAFDCAKLAEVPVEGIRLLDYQNHIIFVHTKNTKYVFTHIQGRVRGQAFKEDGMPIRYLAEEQVVHIHGSTFGGSMIRVGFVGVGMHLEFSTKDVGGITTSEIQSVQIAPLIEPKLMPHQQAAYDDMRSMDKFAY